MQEIVIQNKPNNFLTRRTCRLCGGNTEKQEYHFTLPYGGIVCDWCAEHPEKIPERIHNLIARLRAQADELEAEVNSCRYVTEVVPVPEHLREPHGMDSEDEWPQWMRERLSLPVLSREEIERRYLERERACLEWERAQAESVAQVHAATLPS